LAHRKPAGRWKENEIDVHEYQAMELLVRFWRVTIPRGAVAFSPDQAIYAATWAAGIGPRRRKFMRGKAGGSKNAGHITKSTKPRELCSENDSSPLRPVAKENPFSASMSRWPIRMTPSEAEVTKARRILEAMDHAAKEGKGAVALEGRLIDIASIRMAEALLTKANGIAGP
jgi:hypothetical protein